MADFDSKEELDVQSSATFLRGREQLGEARDGAAW
jgi:hypothetical protein